MSLKAIEMQVALPRTHDAGKIQEQLQQRGQISQDQAAQRAEREDEKKRTSVVKQEQKDGAKLLNDSEHHHDQNQHHPKRKKQEQETQTERHPYKGRIIDFSG